MNDSHTFLNRFLVKHQLQLVGTLELVIEGVKLDHFQQRNRVSAGVFIEFHTPTRFAKINPPDTDGTGLLAQFCNLEEMFCLLWQQTEPVDHFNLKFSQGIGVGCACDTFVEGQSCVYITHPVIRD